MLARIREIIILVHLFGGRLTRCLNDHRGTDSDWSGFSSGSTLHRDSKNLFLSPKLYT